MTSLDEAATYLLRVAGVTLLQLFALGGPALLLIALLSWLSGWVQRLADAVLGTWPYLLLFGWFGTMVHETGHLLTALVFGHQIVSYRPFAPDLKNKTLGSVETKFNPGNLYQYFGIFFISIAPVVFGTLVIFLSLYVLFQEQVADLWRSMASDLASSDSEISSAIRSGFAFLGVIFSPYNFLDWRLYLFLYIAFSVGSSIHLSGADIANAKLGCLPMIVLLFMFNTVLLSLGTATAATFDWLTQYYVFLYMLLCLVILLDLLVIAILWLPASMIRSRG